MESDTPPTTTHPNNSSLQSQVSQSQSSSPSSSSIVAVVCRVCNRNDNRPMIHFPNNPLIPSNNPTYDSLHAFCGKLAAMPPYNKPEWEILSTVGIKNKHGNGYAVKAALTKTRHAMNEANATMMFLAKDFEERLKEERGKLGPVTEVRLGGGATTRGGKKRGPGRPKKERVNKVGGRAWKPAPPGKIRCQCGGTHLPTDTAKGTQSWKTHVNTKRHLEWMTKHVLC